jgi:hypothetical protein
MGGGGAARRFELVVDGRVLAKLAAGEEVELDVPAGSHWLQVRLDWMRSQKVFLYLTGTETAFFSVTPPGGLRAANLAGLFGLPGYFEFQAPHRCDRRRSFLARRASARLPAPPISRYANPVRRYGPLRCRLVAGAANPNC